MLEIVNNKTILVPKGIRYISQWSDYSLDFFQEPHILDKKIPGCGFTEYCITSPMNVILCSPRRILLANKEEQHSDTVLYFKNDLESDTGVDKDLSKKSPKRVFTEKGELLETEEQRRARILNKLGEDLRNYVFHCQFNNIPAKILVTYDSFGLVKSFLEEIHVMNQFYVVIDEFQSVLVDSKFKSSTEIEFMGQLQGIKKVCYVSATPMIEDYLKQIPEFKDLPYYELDWESRDPLRVARPDIDPKITNSITSEAIKVIEEYKSGNSESFRYKDRNGEIKEIKSNEAVFYVNSVNNITTIIKKSGLKPEEVNILCADTMENRAKLKSKLGVKYTIGSVPLKGKPHKMFTICTRTVYLGADFYSECAKSYIFSDANIDSLAVDITLDLPQILGRQRLIENPWKNRATLFYKTLGSKKTILKEVFEKEIERKVNKTNNLLDAYSDVTTEERRICLSEVYRDRADDRNYKEDYIAVNTSIGSIPVPCFNILVKVAEQRAFNIQQLDYKDRFTVFNTLNSENLLESTGGVLEFLKHFDVLQGFPTKMKAICECPLSDEERSVILDQIPIVFRNYYYALGPERLKAQGYNKTRIDKELEDNIRNRELLEQLVKEIYSIFSEGTKYLRSDIKSSLEKIYEKIGYKSTPKATDIENYFEAKQILIGKSRSKGYELIRKKF